MVVSRRGASAKAPRTNFESSEQTRIIVGDCIAEMSKLRVIVALGRIAHESTVRALGGKLSEAAFGHGSRHELGAVTVFSSYHCSRYNTNTGVLTPEMFRDVFSNVRRYLDA